MSAATCGHLHFSPSPLLPPSSSLSPPSSFSPHLTSLYSLSHYVIAHSLIHLFSLFVPYHEQSASLSIPFTYIQYHHKARATREGEALSTTKLPSMSQLLEVHCDKLTKVLLSASAFQGEFPKSKPFLHCSSEADTFAVKRSRISSIINPDCSPSISYIDT
jgi:hypothetical protein